MTNKFKINLYAISFILFSVFYMPSCNNQNIIDNNVHTTQCAIDTIETTDSNKLEKDSVYVSLFEKFDSIIVPYNANIGPFYNFKLKLTAHKATFKGGNYDYIIIEDDLAIKFAFLVEQLFISKSNLQKRNNPIDNITIASESNYIEAIFYSGKMVRTECILLELYQGKNIDEILRLLESCASQYCPTGLNKLVLTEEPIYCSIEQIPEFPGGEAALMKYISQNIQYPTSAMESNIQGRVIVQFVVTKTGEIGEIRVVRSKSPELDKEAIRVVKTLPNFIPGKMNGYAVNVWYTLPITFKLQEL